MPFFDAADAAMFVCRHAVLLTLMRHERVALYIAMRSPLRRYAALFLR